MNIGAVLVKKVLEILKACIKSEPDIKFFRKIHNLPTLIKADKSPRLIEILFHKSVTPFSLGKPDECLLKVFLQKIGEIFVREIKLCIGSLIKEEV